MAAKSDKLGHTGKPQTSSEVGGLGHLVRGYKFHPWPNAAAVVLLEIVRGEIGLISAEQSQDSQQSKEGGEG